MQIQKIKTCQSNKKELFPLGFSTDEIKFKNSAIGTKYCYNCNVDKYQFSQMSFNPGNNISFCGRDFPEKAHCRGIIHGTTLACAAISAAAEEANACSMDAFALRGVQGFMLYLLADELKVSKQASVVYGTTSFFSGASVGVGLSKMITSTAGIAAHGASAGTGTTTLTGGTSNAAISGAVRFVNGALSAYITERIGWGFVKRVNQGRMTLKNQFGEALTYGASAGMIHYGNDLIGDLTSFESVSSLLAGVDSSSASLVGELYDLIHENGIDSCLGMFLINLTTRYIEVRINSKYLTKEQKIEIIKDSILMTAAFSMADRLVTQGANQQVLEQKAKIENLINNSPEDFKPFIREIKYSELMQLTSPSADIINNYKSKESIRNLSDAIKSIMDQLDTSIRTANQSFETKKLNKINQHKEKIKENDLLPILCDPIKLEQMGEKVVMPNCIMFEGFNAQINEDLIKWLGENTVCNFIQLDASDDMLTFLETAEKNYQKNKKRTLFYIKGLDILLNPELSTPAIIGHLKDIMSSCAKDYHSNIIFQAQDASKLDYIALKPHRVTIINTNME
ncbi:MAG: hypothetical protein PHX18_06715 [Candidatus Gastranaerophilales bacterium]|nr:hypothetical protein [Candidatus Gastranaerophilales bacterium]